MALEGGNCAAHTRRASPVGSFACDLSLAKKSIALGVPGCPVGPFEQGLGLGIAQHGLASGIPAQLPAQAQREVRQVTSGGDAVCALQVRDRRRGATCTQSRKLRA